MVKTHLKSTFLPWLGFEPQISRLANHNATVHPLLTLKDESWVEIKFPGNPWRVIQQDPRWLLWRTPHSTVTYEQDHAAATKLPYWSSRCRCIWILIFCHSCCYINSCCFFLTAWVLPLYMIKPVSLNSKIIQLYACHAFHVHSYHPSYHKWIHPLLQSIICPLIHPVSHSSINGSHLDLLPFLICWASDHLHSLSLCSVESIVFWISFLRRILDSVNRT